MTETEPLVGQTAKPASPGRVLGLVGAATFSVVLLFLALDGRSFSGTRSYGLQEKPVCSATIKNSVWNDCGSPCSAPRGAGPWEGPVAASPRRSSD